MVTAPASAPTPEDVARAHTLQAIAMYAQGLAERATAALPHATGADAAYLRRSAQEAASMALRLSNSPGYRIDAPPSAGGSKNA